MVRAAIAMTRHRLVCLVLVSAGALLAACSGGSDSSATPPASEAPPPSSANPPPRTATTGTTEDGEEIVFAGAHALPATPSTTIDREHLIMTPNAPDPNAGWTLEDSLVGLPIDGDLIAEVQTDLGVLFCELFPDRAPHAVAAFVGLARGRRQWWDARAGQWVQRPYYRGTTFHRVIPGYIVQGGDYLGDGTGRVGFSIPLEQSVTLSHDRVGRLALATFDSNPNSGGAQFYITDGPHQELDGTATIFGQCTPDFVVSQIARLVQSGAPDNRPLTPLHVGSVFIRRVVGGVANAHATVPGQPEGEPEDGRGASPGPDDLERGRTTVTDEQAMRDRERLGLPPVPPAPPPPRQPPRPR